MPSRQSSKPSFFRLATPPGCRSSVRREKTKQKTFVLFASERAHEEEKKEETKTRHLQQLADDLVRHAHVAFKGEHALALAGKRVGQR